MRIPGTDGHHFSRWAQPAALGVVLVGAVILLVAAFLFRASAPPAGSPGGRPTPPSVGDASTAEDPAGRDSPDARRKPVASSSAGVAPLPPGATPDPPIRPGSVPTYPAPLQEAREGILSGTPDDLVYWLTVLAGNHEATPGLRLMARQDPHATARAIALRVLGEQKDRDSRPLFERLLSEDEAWNVRNNAAWALAQIDAREALPLLERVAASDPVERVRIEAAAACVALRSERRGEH